MDFLQKLQEWSPDLDIFFKLITYFGETPVLIVIVAILYWLVNKRAAIGFVFVLCLGGYINTFLKGIVGLERPYQSNPFEVKEIASKEGFSFPSGHSQATGSFWTYAILKAKEQPKLSSSNQLAIFTVGTMLMILVPLSRIYLGLHWPSDVFVGVLEGILIAILFFWAAPRVWTQLSQMSEKDQMISVVLVSLLMAWASTVATSIFGNDVIIGANWEMPGVLAGFAVGLILENRYVRFDLPTRDQKKQILFRLIIGVLLIAGLYYGLKFVVSPFEEIEILSGVVETQLMLPFDYLRLALVGLSGAFAIPWFFVQLENKFVNKTWTIYSN